MIAPNTSAVSRAVSLAGGTRKPSYKPRRQSVAAMAGGRTLPPVAAKLLRIDRHPHGPRLYLGGRRCHHGAAGAIAALAALAIHRPRLAACLAAWAATDWRDFPFRDCDNHAPRGRRELTA